MTAAVNPLFNLVSEMLADVESQQAKRMASPPNYNAYLRFPDECVIPNPDGLVTGNLVVQFEQEGPDGDVVLKQVWMESAADCNRTFTIPLTYFLPEQRSAIVAEVEYALS